MDVVIKHYAFPNHALSFPINWLEDPYKNKNWRHHLNSLRWIKTIRNPKVRKRVLTDFYNFHCKKKAFNPYYSSLWGDHTAAIRVSVVYELKRMFEDDGDNPGVGVCNRLINKDIENLQSSEMYRSGHNHGLMVDLALLELVRKERKYRSRVNLDLILERSGGTLDEMWFSSGYTKEHSISYQEFNLPLTIKYFGILRELGVSPKSKVDPEKVKEETKRILGFVLRENGRYFPIGDSFRKSNGRILDEVYGRSEKHEEETFLPYSSMEGVLIKEGLFSKRWKDGKGNRLHIVATCGWNSFNHKQDDELSFCLEINGNAFFDDPGYSTACDKETTSFLKSEKAHSTFLLGKQKWSDKRYPDGNSEIYFERSQAASERLLMRHERVPNFSSERQIVLSNESIKIIDVVSKKNADYDESGDYKVDVVHQFVLSPSVQVQFHEGCCELVSGEVKCLFHYDNGAASLKKIPYVGDEKKNISETLMLNIASRHDVSGQYSILNEFVVEVCYDD